MLFLNLVAKLSALCRIYFIRVCRALGYQQQVRANATFLRATSIRPETPIPEERCGASALFYSNKTGLEFNGCEENARLVTGKQLQQHHHRV